MKNPLKRFQKLSESFRRLSAKTQRIRHYAWITLIILALALPGAWVGLRLGQAKHRGESQWHKVTATVEVPGTKFRKGSALATNTQVRYQTAQGQIRRGEVAAYWYHKPGDKLPVWYNQAKVTSLKPSILQSRAPLAIWILFFGFVGAIVEIVLFLLFKTFLWPKLRTPTRRRPRKFRPA